MSHRLHKPDAYRMRARNRPDITQDILNTTSRRDEAFCFNVKIHNADLSLESLLRHWRDYEGSPPYTSNPRWLKALAALDAENEQYWFDTVSGMRSGILLRGCGSGLRCRSSMASRVVQAAGFMWHLSRAMIFNEWIVKRR